MMRIYTSKDCHYCDKLKELLEKEGYEYFEVDINDKKYEKESNDVFKYVGMTIVPIILKKPHMLVPTKSFNTIEQAIQLIKSLN